MIDKTKIMIDKMRIANKEMRAKKENSCQKLQRNSGRKISLPSKNKDTGEDCPNYKNHHYTLSSVGVKIKDKPDR